MAIQLYVQAKSKADINRRLEASEVLVGTEYKMLEETKYPLNTNLPTGTIIKVFDKTDGQGVPYAKAYGQWDAGLCRVR